MSEPQDNEVTRWAESFDSQNADVRHAAREHLVGLGSQGAAVLERLLDDPRQSVRWEAALGLKDLADPGSVAALVGAMEDPDPDVRWVVSEALAKIGAPGARPVLEALVRRGDSFELRESAHVFITCLVNADLRSRLDLVHQALGKKTSPEVVMEAADRALEQLPPK